MSLLQTPEEMGIRDFDAESGKPARIKRGVRMERLMKEVNFRINHFVETLRACRIDKVLQRRWSVFGVDNMTWLIVQKADLQELSFNKQFLVALTHSAN
jgi:hypothetical protein